MTLENVYHLKENREFNTKIAFDYLHIIIVSLYMASANVVFEYIKKGAEIKQDINQKKITVGYVRNKVKRKADV
jgi:hypothetical protein